MGNMSNFKKGNLLQRLLSNIPSKLYSLGDWSIVVLGEKMMGFKANIAPWQISDT